MFKNFVLLVAVSATFASCGSDAATASATTTVDTTAAEVTTPDTTAAPAPAAAAAVAPATMKAKYVGFEFGDLPHYTFEDEAGKKWSFVGMDAKGPKFEVELSKKETNEKNQGFAANPKLIGKMFNLKTGMTKIPEFVDGPLVDMPSVLEATLVK